MGKRWEHNGKTMCYNDYAANLAKKLLFLQHLQRRPRCENSAAFFVQSFLLDTDEYVRYNVHIVKKEVDCMTNTNATNFRKNIFEYLNQAVEYNDVINVTTKNGNAVVLSESDYNSLLETVYLMSHPATRDAILEGMKEPLEDCVPLDEVDW